jgi:hypothetical protein
MLRSERVGHSIPVNILHSGDTRANSGDNDKSGGFQPLFRLKLKAILKAGRNGRDFENAEKS